MKYYLIAVDGGVEPTVLGPFGSEEERKLTAIRVHSNQEPEDSLFGAEVGESGELEVWSYGAPFFEKEEVE